MSGSYKDLSVWQKAMSVAELKHNVLSCVKVGYLMDSDIAESLQQLDEVAKC